MEKTKLLLQASPALLLLCVIGGLIYAAIMYSKTATWAKPLNYGLATLRAIVVAILLFLLLLNPLLRRIVNLIEKPTIVLAIDNSESMSATKANSDEAVKQLKLLSDALNQENITTQWIDLSNKITSPDSLTWTQTSTDLDRLLTSIQYQYESKNVGAVLLLSDGIVNQGISPAYRTYNYPIYTIGVGDTVPKKDVILKNLSFNKIAYFGNKFPIRAEIAHKGFENQAVNVAVKKEGKTIAEQRINLSAKGFQEIEFLIEASQQGVAHFVIEVQSLEGEFTTKNNTRHAYIDVIDSKEKILLLAAAPHPDIKAIRAAIESKQNYDVTVQVLSTANAPLKNDKYDVVILHQIPSLNNVANNFGIATDWIKNKKVPTWFLVGAQTNLTQFNQLNNAVNIDARSGRTDDVTAQFNSSFSKFLFNTDYQKVITKLPPLRVPFGNINLKGETETLIVQQVGNVKTDKPLFVFNQTEGQKTAVLVGEGLWQWRMAEFVEHSNWESTDELIVKTIQYLSTKDDKRKFRVYPLNTEVRESERVVFETEVYNDIYEPIYNQAIAIKISGEGNKKYEYNFERTAENTRFELSTLPAGAYKYTASAQLNGKTETASGQFTIEQEQLELLNTTADFAMLRELATQNGGKFVAATKIEELLNYLKSNLPKDLVRSTEELSELIQMKWIFWLIVGLLSVEWFTRKWKGSY